MNKSGLIEIPDAKRSYLDQIMREAAGSAILQVLEETKGNKSKAAVQLGISRSRLYRLMKSLEIIPAYSREPGPVSTNPPMPSTGPGIFELEKKE